MLPLLLIAVFALVALALDDGTETPAAPEPTKPGAGRSLAGYAYEQRGVPAPGRPVIVVLHGRGGSTEGALGWLDELGRDAVLVAPRGHAKVGDRPAWFAGRAQQSEQDELAAQMVLEADHFATFLAQVPGAFGSVPIVVGHSQGGMLAAALALRHPGLLRHAVAASAWAPPGARGSGDALTLIHGNADDVVPYARTWAWANKDRIPLVTTGGGHSMGGPLRAAWLSAIREVL